LANILEFNFSQAFSGTVWNMLSVPDSDLLAIEVRDEKKHEARFTIIDFKGKQIICRDKIFNEAWWIGLTAATSEILLLHVYVNPDNPDEKALIAFDFHHDSVLWRADHFSFAGIEGDTVWGTFTTGESPVRAAVNIRNGSSLNEKMTEIPGSFPENIMLRKPFQYIDGNVHFETVKSFLTSRLKVLPVGGVEYLEHEHLIFVSYQVLHESLANFLVVFSEEGELLLQEKLGDHLKGLGLDTFFILSGFLFFVKNKSELTSYRIV
jgi:hypothetical protein